MSTRDIGDGDRNRLRIDQAAIGGLHEHVVDIVCARIGRRLEVGRREEGQGARRGVDRELAGVGTAGKAEANVAPASGSVAVTVVTAVLFSATETAAVAPAPLEVMTGASLTLVTVTAIAWVSIRLPSEACTTTS